jgi:hypothetical protein
MWAGALALYLRGRKARSAAGALVLWSFVVVCTAMWIPGPWMAPPPNPQSLAWFALIGWIVVPWAAWADRRYSAATPA